MWMQVEGAFLDALADLAMRAREAAGVRHHADLAGRFRRLHHVLGVSEAERHRDLDLHVLALRQREERLVVVLVARRRQESPRPRRGGRCTPRDSRTRKESCTSRRTAFALSSVRAAIDTTSTSSIFARAFDVHFAHGPSTR
jgi:hypothetical protein